MDSASHPSRRTTATRLLVGGLFTALIAFIALLVYRIGMLSPEVESLFLPGTALAGYLGAATAAAGAVWLHIRR
jgi:hypothetical protein